MKKIISIVLAALLLSALLVIPTPAAEPNGTLVEIPYTDKAPSMDDALPDASWGDALLHIDKKSPNTGITQYKKSGKVKQDLSLDLYARWTDSGLYICLTSPDPDFRGGLRFWWGDGVQMIVYPGIVDVSYNNGQIWSSRAEYDPWDWCVTFDVDDETPISSDIAAEKSTVYGDTATNTLVVKFAMDAVDLGYRKTENLNEGDYFSIDLIRMDGSDEDPGEAYVGWLEWGNFFDIGKTWAPDPAQNEFVATSDNPKTTSANTFKLVGKTGGATTPDEPVISDPTPLKGKPSIWAEEEVNKALEADLIPEELKDGFTNGISRANLSKILSKLIDKVYGKAPEKTDAKFSDTADADVLKAANLGIITGYDNKDGTFSFKPENVLKRSEMSVIINRVAKLCGQETAGFESEVKFTDTASHWCNGELGWPVHNGIVKGTSDTTFSPENTLTVEQTIMMIYRTYEALK